MNRSIPVAIVAGLLAVPTLAQAPAEATVKAATTVVDLANPPARARAGLDAQLKEMRAGAAIRAMLGNNPRFKAEAAKNQPAFNSAIARMGALQADSLGPILTEMQAASRKAMIDAYARAFTQAELEQIAAFYRTPAGQKLIARQPAISVEVSQAMARSFGPRMEAAQKSLAPKLDAELKKLFPDEAGGGAR
ncbi:MAG: DUF2059 domain-containing protein [Sphingomonadaceae bacterium]